MAQRTTRTISYVRLGDGKRIEYTDEGTIQISDKTTIGSERGTIVLENALVVPHLERNLILVYGLCQNRCSAARMIDIDTFVRRDARGRIETAVSRVR